MKASSAVSVPRRIAVGVLAWIALAVALGASGLFAAVVPLVPVVLATTVVGTIILWKRSAAFRAWGERQDVRVAMAFHLVRIVFGALFLAELAAGNLPRAWAERAGYGDIAVGVLAIVAIVVRRRWVTVGWSLFGLADIVLVVVTAQLAIFVDGDPLLRGALGRLPYALLPTVVVPLVILTHLFILRRATARAVTPPGSGGTPSSSAPSDAAARASSC